MLGPNGAGKSTTLRILSGLIPADSGEAKVCGVDLAEEEGEVRRHIGYLAENNPLPEDLRVIEYLKFRARLKGLEGSRKRERREMIGSENAAHLCSACSGESRAARARRQSTNANSAQLHCTKHPAPSACQDTTASPCHRVLARMTMY